MSHTTDAEPGSALVRTGAVVFGVGAVATLVTVIPLFIGADPLPTVAYAVSMLMGVGFAIAGAGLLRSVAHQRREARRARESQDSQDSPGGPGGGAASQRRVQRER